MRKEDIQDVLHRIPPVDQTTVVLSLHNGMSLTLDVMLRYESQYLLMRGREGGTTDDGRIFFVPYEQISHLKLDKMTRVADIRRMYGETVAMDFEERMAAGEDMSAPQAKAATITTPAPAAPAAASDPASIAKQNLLARIRAARTTSGGSSGSQPPAK